MSDDTTTMWTPTRLLMTHAKGFRDAYLSTASFYQKDKLTAYTNESCDWGLWLHIVAELFGDQINVNEYQKICNAKWPDSDIPRPSELLSQKFRDKYWEWHRKQVREGDNSRINWSFYHAIADIEGRVFETEFNSSIFFEDPLPEDRDERLYQCLIYQHFAFFSDRISDESLEILAVACHENIYYRVCEDDMLMMATLRYYPLRDVFRRTTSTDGQRFFEKFEPLAKREYMRLTDYSAVDFDDLAEQMSRRYPELHSQF